MRVRGCACAPARKHAPNPVRAPLTLSLYLNFSPGLRISPLSALASAPITVSFEPDGRRQASAHLSEEADHSDGAEGEDEGDGEADGGEADEGEADDGQVQQAPAVAEEVVEPAAAAAAVTAAVPEEGMEPGLNDVIQSLSFSPSPP